MAVNIAELMKAAVKAPLEQFDAVHEILQFAIAFFWLLAYGALLQKLRREKTALGLSLQTLFALTVSEFNTVAISIVGFTEFKSQIRLAQLLAHCLSLFLSVVAYYVIVTKFRHASESERDSFGVSWFNICCLRPLRATYSKSSWFGFRSHWITLYVYAIIFGGLLQYFRRHFYPTWFGFYECFNVFVTALALLPQLHMFWTKRNRRVNSLLGRFVVFMLVAKMFSLTYWVSDVWFHGIALPGRGVHIASDSLNILLLLNFTYHAIVSHRRGLNDICLPV